MDSTCNTIGQKIRALRLSRRMTQAQLAGDSITRNMLSLIENGSASPSLGTLAELAGRLNVPVGYFFAENDEDASQFIKMSIIGEIRTHYTEGRYTECLQLCDSLSRQDDEIRLLAAECNLALFAVSAQSCALASAASYLEKASAAAQECVYLSHSIRSTAEFLSLMLRSIHLPEIPLQLSQPELYPASRIPPEMFAYIAALRALEERRTETAQTLLSSGLIHTSQYLDFLSAEISAQKGEFEKASATLRRLLAAPTLGFFTRYHALNAIETYAGAVNDYKTAYQFSTQKVQLLEQFSH